VNRELSHPQGLSHEVAVQARPAPWLRAAGIVVLGSAFAAVCAHVSVPLFFTPVPLSLAPLPVLLLGLLLTPRQAAATFAAYLAEGALGLPVFAPSPLSGLAHLFGPTGGYLLAYPVPNVDSPPPPSPRPPAASSSSPAERFGWPRSHTLPSNPFSRLPSLPSCPETH